MSVRVWVSPRFGWVLRDDRPPVHREVSVRTIYNSRTGQHEELPLAELQHLLRQGQIQALTTCDAEGRQRYRFLLV